MRSTAPFNSNNPNCALVFFPIIRRPPTSTLYPTTPLFRSCDPRRNQSRRSRVGPLRRRQLSAPAAPAPRSPTIVDRSEEHTSELQSLTNLVCRLLLEKKKKRLYMKCNRHRHSYVG